MPDEKDIIEALKGLSFAKLKGQEHSAYSRKGRVGINTFKYKVPDHPGVSGDYNDDPKHPFINIVERPYEPENTQDVLKHELIHHAFRKEEDHPSQWDYFDQAPFTKSFKNYSSPGWQGIAQMLNPDFGLALDKQPNPSNNYHFKDWYGKKGGDAMQELPAHMAINEPERGHVSQEVRDLYMKNLYAWLKKNKKNDIADRIKELIEGQKAYKGTGLLSNKGFEGDWGMNDEGSGR